jgi:pyruvate formate lyase activating enzyme
MKDQEQQGQGGSVTDESRAQMASLKTVLSEQVSPGQLYDPMEDRPGWVQCYACGHLCRIPPGRDGICRVRFNRDGTLFVPDGYVGALQCDPVEKKPFFHALPGSLALSFGMLGCDYHCAYCFTGETRVITNRGVVRIDSLIAEDCIQMPDGGEAASLAGWEALDHEGRFSPIRQVFRHGYRGPVVKVTPSSLTAFRATPDHRIFATTHPALPLSWVKAGSLTPRHFLAVPKPGVLESTQRIPMELAEIASSSSVSRTTSKAGSSTALLERPVAKTTEEIESHFLVPIRQVSEETYDGFVYNLEVEGAHTYTANFFAVHNCQNWITSQALRDPESLAPPMATSPDELVRLAEEHGAPILASTYNEPLITSEWAVKVFTRAQAAGMVCAYISNGNATPRVLDYLRPWVDLYKVDLKGFDAKRYHELGGVLQTVLDTIVNLKQRGFWVEVVTLIVPGFNDSEEELTGIARFLAGVDRNIPWHVTAFHQDYKMTNRPDTSVDVLLRAAEIGRAAGLHFVYAGNRPGRVGKFENTACPECSASLIERIGYTVLANRIRDGRCPQCATIIPGVWSRPGLAGRTG